MKLNFKSDINKDYAAAMNYQDNDLFIVRVQWWTLAGLAILTFLNSIIKIANFYPSPFSWRVISFTEALGTIIIGILVALVPTLLRSKFKNHYLWRILVTFTLTIFAYLFVFVSGGSIEMHFIFFAMIALIVIYSDWRLGWIMLVMIALHHAILNYIVPNWVYFYGRNDIAFIAHALPVIMAVIFTTILTNNQRNSVRVLLEAKVKDEAILASIGDAVMACDKDGLIILFNGVAERLTGFLAKEAIGYHYNNVLKFIKENDEKVIGDLIAEAMKTAQGTKMANHTLLIMKDGRKIPIADSASPIENTQGEVIGCVLIFRDMSREREIDKAKSEFISLASHQLKTPSTAIKLLTERLLSGNMGILTEKQKEYFNDISSSNQRMIDMINTLLNVSRIELGAFTIEASEKDVCAIMQSIFSELKLIINNKHIKLKTIFPEKNIKLILDESLFRMVINNIIINAIHYTTEGGDILVECRVVNNGEILEGKLLEEDSFVVIISDAGYGIPKIQQDKIFTKFFRANNIKEKDTDGTGLGLYISKSILEYSGGLIWFTSRENEGSVFCVAIPITGMKVKAGKKEFLG